MGFNFSSQNPPTYPATCKFLWLKEVKSEEEHVLKSVLEGVSHLTENSKFVQLQKFCACFDIPVAKFLNVVDVLGLQITIYPN